MSFQTINYNSMKPQLMVFVKGWQKENDIQYLYVDVRLHNHTFDTLTFKTTSCDWERIYMTNTKRLTVFTSNLCYYNTIVVVKLAPFESYNKVIKLKTMNGNSIGHTIFKIGIKLNSDVMYNETIWSKNIILN